MLWFRNRTKQGWAAPHKSVEKQKKEKSNRPRNSLRANIRVHYSLLGMGGGIQKKRKYAADTKKILKRKRTQGWQERNSDQNTDLWRPVQGGKNEERREILSEKIHDESRKKMEENDKSVIQVIGVVQKVANLSRLGTRSTMPEGGGSTEK